MNVTVEDLAPCKKLLRVEVESKVVDEAFESMMKDFQLQAALPGSRPGKAPQSLDMRRMLHCSKSYMGQRGALSQREICATQQKSCKRQKNVT